MKPKALASAERFAQGQDTFALAITALLRRNDLTHQEFRELTQWASPDNPVSMAQISYLKSGKVLLGQPCADSIGQCNLGLAWLAGDQSPKAQAMASAGLPGVALQRKLQRPWYLRDPHTGEPLDTGGIVRVWVGRLVPADMTGDQFPSDDALEISRGIAAIIEKWIADEGLTLTQAWQRIAQEYPSKDPDSIEKLRRLVSMGEEWTAEELAAEIDNLVVLVGKLSDGHPLTCAELLEAIYRRG